MKALTVAVLVSLCASAFVLPACSSDSDKTTNGDGGAGGGADAGTGGKGTGGAATGGSGTGGKQANSCAIDAGTECLTCLADACCDTITECLGDARCKAAFDEYQGCMKDPKAVDKSSCFSGFLLSADAGLGNGGLADCVINPCTTCGGPSPL